MSEQKVRRHDRAAMKQSLERPIARHERKLPRQWAEEESLLTLAAVSLLAGTVTGLVGAAFRVLLEKAESLRDSLIVWAHAHHYWLGLVLVLTICAGATAIAAWLVRRFSPHASGSGIPHVEAVLNVDLPPAAPQLVPVKFFGGLLAIGSGLAIGREGPTVQMGASISHLIGKLCGRSEAENLVLLAAGAGAGLATAFNAPIAGMVFVLEELAGRFDTRITVATFGASATAIAVGRMIMGEAPNFVVPPLQLQGLAILPACLLFGAVAGLLGVAYNGCVLGALSMAERLHRIPMEARAALIGAAVGLIAWFAPALVGGGHLITQRTLAGAMSISIMPLVFLLRFGMGPVSYASGTPGGLFAPMLVLGAQMGLMFGTVYGHLVPHPPATPVAFAVTGIAAFFAAVVRAPVTGIILVVELTGSYSQFFPMLAACFTAMLVPTMLRNPPIYDMLRPVDRE